jgi:hypothetical protein
MRCVAMLIDMGSGSTCFRHESFPIGHNLMAVSARVRGLRIVVISISDAHLAYLSLSKRYFK